MAVEKTYPEGLLGRKVGMTQIFSEDGAAIPVTVLELGPCTILSTRNKETDGYSAVQFGFGTKKSQRVNKPLMGHFAKAGQGAYYHVREIRCDVEKLGWTETGAQINVSQVFEQDEKVDVSATSIGRGFSGVFKKFGMKGQPATRGTHECRRHGGAIGNRKSPGRVFKNKRMPGQYGNERVTIQNLKIVAVRPEENILLVKGCVPGAKGSLVEVRKAVKSYTGPVNRMTEPEDKTEEVSEQEAA